MGNFRVLLCLFFKTSLSTKPFIWCSFIFMQIKVILMRMVSSFEGKRSCFAPFSKRFASTLTVFVSFSPVHTRTPYPFWKRFYTLSAQGQVNSMHVHFNISIREIDTKWSHMVVSVRNFGYSGTGAHHPEPPSPIQTLWDNVCAYLSPVRVESGTRSQHNTMHYRIRFLGNLS